LPARMSRSYGRTDLNSPCMYSFASPQSVVRSPQSRGHGLIACRRVPRVEGATRFCIVPGVASAVAQDPHSSQLHAAPLSLTAAFAGSTTHARAGIKYRNQWPAIDANFTTMSFFADYFIEDKSSGVGLLVTRDREGLAGLRSLSLGLQYSYELQVTDYLGFRPGVQLAMFNRDVNFNRLTFGDQFDPTTGDFIDQPSAETFNTNFSK